MNNSIGLIQLIWTLLNAIRDQREETLKLEEMHPPRRSQVLPGLLMTARLVPSIHPLHECAPRRTRTAIEKSPRQKS